MFVMSPAYFVTLDVVSRNLIQVNIPRVCICGYIYLKTQNVYISKCGVYIEIKVETELWNLCLKRYMYFLITYR